MPGMCGFGFRDLGEGEGRGFLSVVGQPGRQSGLRLMGYGLWR